MMGREKNEVTTGCKAVPRILVEEMKGLRDFSERAALPSAIAIWNFYIKEIPPKNHIPAV